MYQGTEGSQCHGAKFCTGLRTRHKALSSSLGSYWRVNAEFIGPRTTLPVSESTGHVIGTESVVDLGIMRPVTESHMCANLGLE